MSSHRSAVAARPVRPATILVLVALFAGGCTAGTRSSTDSGAAGPPGATVVLMEGRPTFAGVGPPEPPHLPVDDQLVARVQTILDASMEPGAVDWNCCGVDAPPTAVSAQLSVPGVQNVLGVAGTDTDGTPVDPFAPFSVGTLTSSLVATVVLQLIDEDALAAGQMVGRWTPEQPNAERITVQMLLDGTHGWAGLGDVADAHIAADPERRWTLAEVLSIARTIPPQSEPGEFHLAGADVAATALASIAEQATGMSLAELVRTRITEPAGLAGTAVRDGTDLPDDHRSGVVVFGGQQSDTSTVPQASAFTFAAAWASVTSTLSDLTKLLGAWRDGSLFHPSRTPRDSNFRPDRTQDGGPLTRSVTVDGLGVPYDGFCPCATTRSGTAPTSIGLTADTAGSSVVMRSYDDGISVVLHVNGRQRPGEDTVETLADRLHTAAAAAL